MTVNYTDSSIPVIHAPHEGVLTWFKFFKPMFDEVLAVLHIIAFLINLCHLTVLNRPQLRSSLTFRLLLFICIFETISCIFKFLCFSPFWIPPPRAPGEECFVTKSYREAKLKEFGVPLLDVTSRNATWTLILLVVTSLLSTWVPEIQWVRTASSLSGATWIIVVGSYFSIYWSSIVWNEYRVVQFDYDRDCQRNPVKLTTPRYLTQIPENLQLPIINTIYQFIKVLPSMIDPILAILLFLQIKLAPSELSEIKLIFGYCITFYFMELPNSIIPVVMKGFQSDPTVLAISYIVAEFAETFPVLNSISHIFLCLLLSKKYRKVALGMFGRS